MRQTRSTGTGPLHWASVLLITVFLVGQVNGISKNFHNSSMPEMRPTFVVNFDMATVICQHSEDPSDLHLHEMSILCNGRPDCFNNPAMHDESFPYCERKCNSTCSDRGACLYDGEKPQCYCNSGYSGPMCEIEDKNECADKPCHWLAHCQNTLGSYSCKCFPGFHGDGHQCADIDECALGIASCPQNSECVNLPGTYFCNCTQGYAPKGLPLERCEDIDECAKETDNCGKEQLCQNTNGGFSCVDGCDSGYERIEGRCIDLDECQALSPCDSRAICTNTPGGYECKCEQGLQGDGKTCRPITDCSVEENVCDRHAFCISSLKMCICQAGYAGDGVYCHDVNECDAMENPCSSQSNSRCVNIQGGYICCDQNMDDERCIKEQGAYCSGGCGLHAMCYNETCQCMEGFVGDPHNKCIDINECETDNMCSGVGQWCVNMLGGHLCCGPDSKEPECAQGVHVFKTADGEVLLQHNSSAAGAQLLLESGKTETKQQGGFIIQHHGQGNLPSVHINENHELTCVSYCPANSECKDGVCKCLTGFFGSPIFGCEDINECVTSDPCLTSTRNGVWCVNTIGSFHCCDEQSNVTECIGLEISTRNGLRVIGSSAASGSASGSVSGSASGSTSGLESGSTSGSASGSASAFASSSASSSGTGAGDSGSDLVASSGTGSASGTSSASASASAGATATANGGAKDEGGIATDLEGSSSSAGAKEEQGVHQVIHEQRNFSAGEIILVRNKDKTSGDLTLTGSSPSGSSETDKELLKPKEGELGLEITSEGNHTNLGTSDGIRTTITIPAPESTTIEAILSTLSGDLLTTTGIPITDINVITVTKQGREPIDIDEDDEGDETESNSNKIKDNGPSIIPDEGEVGLEITGDGIKPTKKPTKAENETKATGQSSSAEAGSSGGHATSSSGGAILVKGGSTPDGQKKPEGEEQKTDTESSTNKITDFPSPSIIPDEGELGLEITGDGIKPTKKPIEAGTETKATGQSSSAEGGSSGGQSSSSNGGIVATKGGSTSEGILPKNSEGETQKPDVDTKPAPGEVGLEIIGSNIKKGDGGSVTDIEGPDSTVGKDGDVRKPINREPIDSAEGTTTSNTSPEIVTPEKSTEDMDLLANGHGSGTGSTSAEGSGTTSTIESSTENSSEVGGSGTVPTSSPTTGTLPTTSTETSVTEGSATTSTEDKSTESGELTSTIAETSVEPSSTPSVPEKNLTRPEEGEMGLEIAVIGGKKPSGDKAKEKEKSETSTTKTTEASSVSPDESGKSTGGKDTNKPEEGEQGLEISVIGTTKKPSTTKGEEKSSTEVTKKTSVEEKEETTSPTSTETTQTATTGEPSTSTAPAQPALKPVEEETVAPETAELPSSTTTNPETKDTPKPGSVPDGADGGQVITKDGKGGKKTPDDSSEPLKELSTESSSEVPETTTAENGLEIVGKPPVHRGSTEEPSSEVGLEITGGNKPTPKPEDKNTTVEITPDEEGLEIVHGGVPTKKTTVPTDGSTTVSPGVSTTVSTEDTTAVSPDKSASSTVSPGGSTTISSDGSTTVNSSTTEGEAEATTVDVTSSEVTTLEATTESPVKHAATEATSKDATVDSTTPEEKHESSTAVPVSESKAPVTDETATIVNNATSTSESSTSAGSETTTTIVNTEQVTTVPEGTTPEVAGSSSTADSETPTTTEVSPELLTTTDSGAATGATPPAPVSPEVSTPKATSPKVASTAETETVATTEVSSTSSSSGTETGATEPATETSSSAKETGATEAATETSSSAKETGATEAAAETSSSATETGATEVATETSSSATETGATETATETSSSAKETGATEAAAETTSSATETGATEAATETSSSATETGATEAAAETSSAAKETGATEAAAETSSSATETGATETATETNSSATETAATETTAETSSSATKTGGTENATETSSPATETGATETATETSSSATEAGATETATETSSSTADSGTATDTTPSAPESPEVNTPEATRPEVSSTSESETLATTEVSSTASSSVTETGATETATESSEVVASVTELSSIATSSSTTSEQTSVSSLATNAPDSHLTSTEATTPTIEESTSAQTAAATIVPGEETSGSSTVAPTSSSSESSSTSAPTTVSASDTSASSSPSTEPTTASESTTVESVTSSASEKPRTLKNAKATEAPTTPSGATTVKNAAATEPAVTSATEEATIQTVPEAETTPSTASTDSQEPAETKQSVKPSKKTTPVSMRQTTPAAETAQTDQTSTVTEETTTPPSAFSVATEPSVVPGTNHETTISTTQAPKAETFPQPDLVITAAPAQATESTTEAATQRGAGSVTNPVEPQKPSEPHEPASGSGSTESSETTTQASTEETSAVTEAEASTKETTQIPLEVTTLQETKQPQLATLPTSSSTTKDSFSLANITTVAPTVPSLSGSSGLKCSGSDECGSDAYCERRTGACRCHPGFSGNPPEKKCVDVDECKDNLHKCHGSSKCHNFNGGYACFCPQGFRKMEDGTCVDINECKEHAGGCCSSNATCINRPGTYSCQCHDGFTGDGYSCIPIQKRPCHIEEDQVAMCPKGHMCMIDSAGKTDCEQCMPGYKKRNGVCEDVDECANKTANMCNVNAKCANAPGAYICKCNDGFMGDGFMCSDIDECLNNPCHPHAECKNTIGTFECTCPEGWTGDGKKSCINPVESSCEDLEKTCGRVTNTACLTVRVFDGTLKAVCECEANYRLNSPTGQCEDINECAENRHDCDPSNSKCVNEDGGFECECLPGFEGKGGICVDIDECKMGTSGCHSMATCQNTRGGCDCKCMNGFAGNGTMCTKMPFVSDRKPQTTTDSTESKEEESGECPENWVRSCRLENKTCHVDEEAVPQCGSCIPGHQPVNGYCQPINGMGPCSAGMCDPNADCIDVPTDRHFCSCRIGYIGDGMRCDDVDECSVAGVCHSDAKCTNTNGSFECTCRHGFTGNGFACTVIAVDEDKVKLPGPNCHLDTGLCHPQAQCMLNGTCVCNSGFKGDGIKICTQITMPTTQGRAEPTTESPSTQKPSSSSPLPTGQGTMTENLTGVGSGQPNLGTSSPETTSATTHAASTETPTTATTESPTTATAVLSTSTTEPKEPVHRVTEEDKHKGIVAELPHGKQSTTPSVEVDDTSDDTSTLTTTTKPDETNTTRTETTTTTDSSITNESEITSETDSITNLPITHKFETSTTHIEGTSSTPEKPELTTEPTYNSFVATGFTTTTTSTETTNVKSELTTTDSSQQSTMSTNSHVSSQVPIESTTIIPHSTTTVSLTLSNNASKLTTTPLEVKNSSIGIITGTPEEVTNPSTMSFSTSEISSTTSESEASFEPSFAIVTTTPEPVSSTGSSTGETLSISIITGTPEIPDDTTTHSETGSISPETIPTPAVPEEHIQGTTIESSLGKTVPTADMENTTTGKEGILTVNFRASSMEQSSTTDASATAEAEEASSSMPASSPSTVEPTDSTTNDLTSTKKIVAEVPTETTSTATTEESANTGELSTSSTVGADLRSSSGTTETATTEGGNQPDDGSTVNMSSSTAKDHSGTLTTTPTATTETSDPSIPATGTDGMESTMAPISTTSERNPNFSTSTQSDLETTTVNIDTSSETVSHTEGIIAVNFKTTESMPLDTSTSEAKLTTDALTSTPEPLVTNAATGVTDNGTPSITTELPEKSTSSVSVDSVTVDSSTLSATVPFETLASSTGSSTTDDDIFSSTSSDLSGVESTTPVLIVFSAQTTDTAPTTNDVRESSTTPEPTTAEGVIRIVEEDKHAGIEAELPSTTANTVDRLPNTPKQLNIITSVPEDVSKSPVRIVTGEGDSGSQDSTTATAFTISSSTLSTTTINRDGVEEKIENTLGKVTGMQSTTDSDFPLSTHDMSTNLGHIVSSSSLSAVTAPTATTEVTNFPIFTAGSRVPGRITVFHENRSPVTLSSIKFTKLPSSGYSTTYQTSTLAPDAHTTVEKIANVTKVKPNVMLPTTELSVSTENSSALSITPSSRGKETLVINNHRNIINVFHGKHPKIPKSDEVIMETDRRGEPSRISGVEHHLAGQSTPNTTAHTNVIVKNSHNIFNFVNGKLQGMNSDRMTEWDHMPRHNGSSAEMPEMPDGQDREEPNVNGTVIVNNNRNILNIIRGSEETSNEQPNFNERTPPTSVTQPSATKTRLPTRNPSVVNTIVNNNQNILNLTFPDTKKSTHFPEDPSPTIPKVNLNTNHSGNGGSQLTTSTEAGVRQPVQIVNNNHNILNVNIESSKTPSVTNLPETNVPFTSSGMASSGPQTLEKATSKQRNETKIIPDIGNNNKNVLAVQFPENFGSSKPLNGDGERTSVNPTILDNKIHSSTNSFTQTTNWDISDAPGSTTPNLHVEVSSESPTNPSTSSVTFLVIDNNFSKFPKLALVTEKDGHPDDTTNLERTTTLRPEINKPQNRNREHDSFASTTSTEPSITNSVPSSNPGDSVFTIRFTMGKLEENSFTTEPTIESTSSAAMLTENAVTQNRETTINDGISTGTAVPEVGNFSTIADATEITTTISDIETNETSLKFSISSSPEAGSTPEPEVTHQSSPNPNLLPSETSTSTVFPTTYKNAPKTLPTDIPENVVETTGNTAAPSSIAIDHGNGEQSIVATEKTPSGVIIINSRENIINVHNRLPGDPEPKNPRLPLPSTDHPTLGTRPPKGEDTSRTTAVPSTLIENSNNNSINIGQAPENNIAITNQPSPANTPPPDKPISGHGEQLSTETKEAPSGVVLINNNHNIINVHNHVSPHGEATHPLQSSTLPSPVPNLPEPDKNEGGKAASVPTLHINNRTSILHIEYRPAGNHVAEPPNTKNPPIAPSTIFEHPARLNKTTDKPAENVHIVVHKSTNVLNLTSHIVLGGPESTKTNTTMKPNSAVDGTTKTQMRSNITIVDNDVSTGTEPTSSLPPSTASLQITTKQLTPTSTPEQNQNALVTENISSTNDPISATSTVPTELGVHLQTPTLSNTVGGIDSTLQTTTTEETSSPSIFVEDNNTKTNVSTPANVQQGSSTTTARPDVEEVTFSTGGMSSTQEGQTPSSPSNSMVTATALSTADKGPSIMASTTEVVQTERATPLNQATVATSSPEIVPDETDNDGVFVDAKTVAHTSSTTDSSIGSFTTTIDTKPGTSMSTVTGPPTGRGKVFTIHPFGSELPTVGPQPLSSTTSPDIQLTTEAVPSLSVTTNDGKHYRNSSGESSTVPGKISVTTVSPNPVVGTDTNSSEPSPTLIPEHSRIPSGESSTVPGKISVTTVPPNPVVSTDTNSSEPSPTLIAEHSRKPSGESSAVPGKISVTTVPPNPVVGTDTNSSEPSTTLIPEHSRKPSGESSTVPRKISVTTVPPNLVVGTDTNSSEPSPTLIPEHSRKPSGEPSTVPGKISVTTVPPNPVVGTDTNSSKPSPTLIPEHSRKPSGESSTVPGKILTTFPPNPVVGTDTNSSEPSPTLIPEETNNVAILVDHKAPNGRTTKMPLSSITTKQHGTSKVTTTTSSIGGKSTFVRSEAPINHEGQTTTFSSATSSFEETTLSSGDKKPGSLSSTTSPDIQLTTEAESSQKVPHKIAETVSPQISAGETNFTEPLPTNVPDETSSETVLVDLNQPNEKTSVRTTTTKQQRSSKLESTLTTTTRSSPTDSRSVTSEISPVGRTTTVSVASLPVDENEKPTLVTTASNAELASTGPSETTSPTSLVTFQNRQTVTTQLPELTPDETDTDSVLVNAKTGTQTFTTVETVTGKVSTERYTHQPFVTQSTEKESWPSSSNMPTPSPANNLTTATTKLVTIDEPKRPHTSGIMSPGTSTTFAPTEKTRSPPYKGLGAVSPSSHEHHYTQHRQTTHVSRETSSTPSSAVTLPAEVPRVNGSVSGAKRCTVDDRSACHSLAICDVGQGACRCKEGYTGDGYTECKKSATLDCVIDPSVCDSRAICNTQRRRCECEQGYIGDGIICAPHPQDCIVRKNLCSPEAICSGRRCQCVEGFTGDGIKCVSLYQRSANCTECDPNAHCDLGQCKCNFGYFGNGMCCVPDPRDCVHFPGVCNPDAYCDKEKRECKCNHGFLGDGVSCFPQRSCRTMPSLCHKDAVCLPTGTCLCKHGFDGDGYSCKKRSFIPHRETQISDVPSACGNKCDKESELCINAQCECKNGYDRVNGACTDVNECVFNPCHQLATCTNMPGTFSCTCPDGYTGDGKSCVQHVKLGELGVYCEPDGMTLVLSNETDIFEGRIFVRGQAENPHCAKQFSSFQKEERPYTFRVPFEYCNVRVEAKDTFAATVVVQKHPMFITTAADAYDLRCTYPAGVREVMSHVNVTDLKPSTVLQDQDAGPLCSLTVSNEEEETINSAIVGQNLKLTLEVQPNQTYSILPKNCFAINIETGERYSLTDRAGCAIDAELFPEWTRVRPSKTQALFRTFKWPDSSMIRFQCDCSACVGDCPPIDCQRRREAAQRAFRFRRVRHTDGNELPDPDDTFLAEEVKAEAREEEALNAKVIDANRLAFTGLVSVNDGEHEAYAQQHIDQWKTSAQDDDILTEVDDSVCVRTVLLALSLVLTLICIGLLIGSCVRYRRRKLQHSLPTSVSLSSTADMTKSYLRF